MRSRTILLMSLFLFVVTTATAGDWPYWRGPKYTGVTEESAWSMNWPKSGPKVLWDAQVGIGFSSMTIADGKVYTMGHQMVAGKEHDVVYCLDAKSGDEIWRYSYAEPKNPKLYEGGPNATPTVAQGKVYTMSRQGKVFCFNAVNGDVVWHRDIAKSYGIKSPQWGLSGSPVVLGNVVYLNAGDAGLALSTKDGSKIWQNGTKDAGYASVVPYSQGDQLNLAVFAGTAIKGVRAKDGEVLWQHPWETKYAINAADPLLIGQDVFVSSGYGFGCGLLSISGSKVKEVYKHKNLKNQCYGSVLYKGYLYGFDGQVGRKKGKFLCMNPKSGEVIWEHEGDLGIGTVLVAGDKLIVLGERGKLVVAEASPKGFKPLTSAQVLNEKCWTVPALANGLLYVRDAQGNLKCLDLR